MKIKIICFLISFICLLSSCGEDPAPVYKWQTVWTEDYQDIEGTTIVKNTVVDLVQYLNDEGAKLGVSFPVSSLLFFAADSIFQDVIQQDGDFKSRRILYKYPEYLITSDLPLYQCEIYITYTKIE